MKNRFLQFTFFILSSLTLSSCSSGPAIEDYLPMSYPNMIHSTMSINVLSYKLLNDSSQVPSLGNPPGGRKFIAIHLIVANPGKHNGLPSSQFSSVLEEIQLSHPSNPSALYEMSILSLREPLESSNKDLPTKSIAPSSSISGWIIGTIPKDLNTPFIVKFTPKSTLKPSREIQVKVE